MLLHLASLARSWESGDPPPGSTQKDIARSAGLRTTHASRALDVLGSEGLVDSEKGRPAGAKKKVNVYRATPEGYASALEILERTGGGEVLTMGPGGDIAAVRLTDLWEDGGDERGFLTLLGVHRAMVRDGPILDTHPSELIAGDADGGVDGVKDVGSGEPAAPELFVGREWELEKMEEFVRSTVGGADPVVVVVLEGPRGVGKKALAQRFSTSPDKRCGSRRWIDHETGLGPAVTGGGGGSGSDDGGGGPLVLVLSDIHLRDPDPGSEPGGELGNLVERALTSCGRPVGSPGDGVAAGGAPDLVLVTVDEGFALGPDLFAAGEGEDGDGGSVMEQRMLTLDCGGGDGGGVSQVDVPLLSIRLAGLDEDGSVRLMGRGIPRELARPLARFSGGNPGVIWRLRETFQGEGASGGKGRKKGLNSEDRALLKFLKAGGGG